MPTLRYAGIGARATPAAVLSDMTAMAAWLARTGCHLSSGGADGADTAFAGGTPAEQRTIWLPWRGYNGHRGPDGRVLSEAELSACMEIAAPLHPAWNRCPPAVRRLHARNAAVLLDGTLDRPVDAVVCWSERGAVTGGTGMAIRIAENHSVPVFTEQLPVFERCAIAQRAGLSLQDGHIVPRVVGHLAALDAPGIFAESNDKGNEASFCLTLIL